MTRRNTKTSDRGAKKVTNASTGKVLKDNETSPSITTKIGNVEELIDDVKKSVEKQYIDIRNELDAMTQVINDETKIVSSLCEKMATINHVNIDIAKTTEYAYLPTSGTSGSAGLDLYSNEEVVIRPGETVSIHTGIKTSFPEEYVGLVFPRSGLSIKSGITLANCVGVIDSDYRGEWIVALYNHQPKPSFFNRHKNDVTIALNDRIAQVIFVKRGDVQLNLVDEDDLDDTDRGEGGFGSTGVHLEE